ncbi:MAG: MBL fold metallo-hydrolase [Vicinamibacterales bacterium]
MATRRDFFQQSARVILGGTIASRILTSPAFARPALAGGASAQAGAGATPQAPAVTPVFTALRRNVGVFTGRGGTIGYLVDRGGVAVVDSQFPDTAQLCLDGLNSRSGNRPVDLLVNTHHHADHTSGNIAFKGVAKRVLAHATAAQHMRQPPGRPAPTGEQLYPGATFTNVWREQVGDEWIRAQYFGRAHTSGDAVITFERANVAHMGDLMFNRRHPVIDRPAGASIAHWGAVLEQAAAAHDADTIFVFGHAGANQPITGSRADLRHFRDYLAALLTFVRGRIAAGDGAEAVAAIRDPLPGFEDHGPLTAAPLQAAFGEITEGTGLAS